MLRERGGKTPGRGGLEVKGGVLKKSTYRIVILKSAAPETLH